MPGYHGDGRTCEDVDECASGTYDCDGNAHCINTAGSYECACTVGWAGDGKTCEDVDECATGAHDCPEHSHCKNTLGSYVCLCDVGYQVLSI